MKTFAYSTLFSLCVLIGSSAVAQDFYDDDESSFQNKGDIDEQDEYQSALQREKYKTAIARERTERAYLESRERSYQHSQQMQDIYESRSRQESDYVRRTNDISSINQAANTAANIARQVENIGRWGRGW